MSDADAILMGSIKAKWATAIEDATASSSVPPALLAALVAGESNGKTDAQRYEPAVFERLKEVLLGARPHYAPSGVKRIITRVDLSAYCDPGVGEERGDFASSLQCLHDLSTSWGLTQIMGWHLVEFQVGMGTPWLATPGGNLRFATQLLAWFAELYHLDLTADFEQLFCCWNTGEPTGTTHDPNYVSNGLARLALWRANAQSAG
jgi:hypothetical protein